jgi:ABC-2 type transport system ATP-binding protein
MKTTSNDEWVIRLEGVTRYYGAKAALREVSLRVPRGVVLGLVGANGAGKTTLIKHVLGLLRAKEGEVRIFGLDPVRSVVTVLGRLGYLSEDRDLPPWMTVGELIRYSRAFYPAWDDGYAERMRERFQLPAGARIRNLSKGELAKAGLLVALAHRPELLVLDEPSSGLDPLVRREMLEAVVRSVAEEGRTVVFSSHLLDEIGRVSDRVAMLVQGRLVMEGALSEVLEGHRRLVIRLPAAGAAEALMPGVLSLSGGPREWTVIANGDAGRLRDWLEGARGEVLEESGATFEEVFHARASSGISAQGAPVAALE